MVSEPEYSTMKAKVPEIKQLFQTRHYLQCVSLCELTLLTRAIDQVHPVHLAYVHFYLAMSHDTMAREATLRRRKKELQLAEQHYLATMDALVPAWDHEPDDVPERSPTSPASEDEHVAKGRRVSDASQRSMASSATSFESDNDNATAKRSSKFDQRPWNGSTTFETTTKRRPTPIFAPNGAHSYREEQLSAELSSFLKMVRTHLTSVRELQDATAAPTVRFSFSRSRSSTVDSRPASRDYSSHDQSDLSQKRWSRQYVNFRPRFDPTSVRNLCNEALSEL